MTIFTRAGVWCYQFGLRYITRYLDFHKVNTTQARLRYASLGHSHYVWFNLVMLVLVRFWNCYQAFYTGPINYQSFPNKNLYNCVHSATVPVAITFPHGYHKFTVKQKLLTKNGNHFSDRAKSLSVNITWKRQNNSPCKCVILTGKHLDKRSEDTY